MVETQSTGKTALITGASSGIGAALSHCFAADSYDVILAARGVAKMEALGTELSQKHAVKVEVIGVDLEVADGAHRLFGEVKRHGLTLDALVNNAGYAIYQEFKDCDLDAELKLMQINMATLVALTRLFLPDLLARKGGVLNVASLAAFQPGPMWAVYGATKAFVLSFSEALAEELSHDGVTVTALCPGITASGFEDRAGAQNSALVKGKRLPTADDVARVGYAAFRQGRRVVVPGVINRILEESVRFAPRRVASAVAAWMLRRV